MNIVVKPSVINELQKVSLMEKEGIKVEAVFIGSCAIYVDHHLYVEKKGDDDDLLWVEGIPFLISKESQRHLPDTIYLDFNPNLGYKVSSDEETYCYNLILKRREKEN